MKISDFLKKIKDIKILKDIFLVLVGALIGLIPCYFENFLNKPLINYFVRNGYYKIDNTSIGNVFLENDGRTLDTNITIIIYENLKKEDININNYTSNYQIRNNNNKTIVVLDKLKPTESADITFKIENINKDDFDFDIISDNNNIKSIY